MQCLARLGTAPSHSATTHYVTQFRAPATVLVLPMKHRHRAAPVCRTTSGVTSEVAASAPTSTDPAASGAAAAVPSNREDARAIVDQVLEAIKGTDSGANISRSQRIHTDSLIRRLEVIGAQQQPRPLENPLLWGNYNVVYTSAGKDEGGEPAGGRFRGPVGRALFHTMGLFQSVLQPDLATNKVEFKLLGVIPGYVGLRGRVLPVGDTGDKVMVLFEPPVLSIAGKVHLRIGFISTVTLTTTYLDERVRLGKGSRGSLFVFTRGGAADSAAMDQVGLEQTSFRAAAVFGAFFLSLALGGAALWVTGNVAAKALALLTWLLAAGIGAVMNRGGLILDRAQEREAAEAAFEVERRKQEELLAKAAAAAKAEGAGAKAEAGAQGQGDGVGGAVTPAAA